MIAYLDASVILRLVMKEADPLQEWPDIVQGVASTLAEVEVFRTLDRMRFYDPLVPDRALAARREAAFGVMEGLETVEITRTILSRAAQPLPTALGSLDAIHLVSAMSWREEFGNLFFATHDRGLGICARASGFKVLGVSLDDLHG